MKRCIVLSWTHGAGVAVPYCVGELRLAQIRAFRRMGFGVVVL